jgi:hypothetical protein
MIPTPLPVRRLGVCREDILHFRSAAIPRWIEE